MHYYSTKRVAAEPRERLTQGSNDLQPGMHLTYEDGYESWCPLPVFQRDYQPVNAMSFGHALHALKRGGRVCRQGWNGKGMWLVLVTDKDWMIDIGVAGETEGVLPFLAMRTVDNMLVPWLCSQTDMLADDWMIVEA